MAQGKQALRNALHGNGLIKPLRRLAGDFVSGGGAAGIAAEIEQLLGTRPGDLPWRPEVGIDLEAYRHRNLKEGLADVVADEIVEAIEDWVPSVSAALAVVDSQESTMKIKVTFKSIVRNNNRSNVVLGPSIVELEY
jgi:phage baseplate assembly protein W